MVWGITFEKLDKVGLLVLGFIQCVPWLMQIYWRSWPVAFVRFFFSNMKPPLKTFFFYSFRSIRSVYQENLDKQPNFLLGKTIRGSWNTRVKKAQQQHIWNASRRRKKKAHIICSHIIFSVESRKKILAWVRTFFTSKAIGKDAGRHNLVPTTYYLGLYLSKIVVLLYCCVWKLFTFLDNLYSFFTFHCWNNTSKAWRPT